MKLASKEAIGLMLDGEVLTDKDGRVKAWYTDAFGFRHQYLDRKPEPLYGAWNSEGWELQKKYKPIPEEFTYDWAKYRAVDANGELWEYEHFPFIWNSETYHWSAHEHNIGKYKYISDGHNPDGWRNSLERKSKIKSTIREDFSYGGYSILKDWVKQINSQVNSCQESPVNSNKTDEEELEQIISRISRIEKKLGIK